MDDDEVKSEVGQRQLQKEVALDLVPMTRKQASGNRNAKWMGDAANTRMSIKFATKGIFAYDNLKVLKIHSDVFYVPKSAKQAAFDSFILYDEVLYIIQITIASSRPIKHGIMDFDSHEKLREAQWHFIFVVPRGETTECSESKVDELKEFWDRATPLFTAEFDPEKYRDTSPEPAGQASAQSPARHRQGSARDDANVETTPTQPALSSTDAPAEPRSRHYRHRRARARARPKLCRRYKSQQSTTTMRTKPPSLQHPWPRCQWPHDQRHRSARLETCCRNKTQQDPRVGNPASGKTTNPEKRPLPLPVSTRGE
jgi:hypothetical protein